MSVLIVTGTGTDVGKTIATAALAACLPGRIAVVKPAQTGVAPSEPGDLAEVTRLSGCTDVFEFARYPDPLSPHHAARRCNLPALDMATTGMRIAELDNQYDSVLVEGAGGLLVPYNDDDGWTLVQLAQKLQAPMMVVARADLGTLNHTALTVRVIKDEAIELAGIMVGSWPREPGLPERYTVFDLAAMDDRSELSGILPAEMATMRDFTEQARAALAPRFGGTFDWSAFRSSV
ncbi:MAG: dethiobiotin synthase [Jatrophihabitantaceae bacterium]